MALAIPYLVFLGLYVVVVLVTLLFCVFSMYHLLRFGFLSPLAVVMSFVIIAGVVLIVASSYQVLSHIDWGQSLELGQYKIQSAFSNF